ncbi:hypothetical protein PC119_g14615 [Phytophthora cactorum]|nr:hypothetical protein PC112_g13767 [Phytophthora cactorum]KAG2896927.1 hypothetical protein PC114_g14887 [Phytophthora cactorum]KAG3007349.1 hypothetical protein PC119_g14615 [Phytophthora cactorum]KAG4054806.1 hypothetical protein PC123_g10074 [Phytophthora cactorum]
MKCAKVGCCFGDLEKTSPCCICGRQVHHICSNELCSNAELSKRFCSSTCVNDYLGNDNNSQKQTPSSSPSGISISSQKTWSK